MFATRGWMFARDQPPDSSVGGQLSEFAENWIQTERGRGVAGKRMDVVGRDGGGKNNLKLYLLLCFQGNLIDMQTNN